MRKLLVFACVLLIFIAVCPCGHESDAANMRVACIMELEGGRNWGYWQELYEGLDEAAEAGGVSLLYLETSKISRVDAVRIACLSDMDAIITIYADDADFLSALIEARAKGILVIFVDRDGPAEYRDVYVGIDNISAGRALADYALTQMQEGDAAVAFRWANHSNLQERLQGMRQEFQSAGHQFYSYDLTNKDDGESLHIVEDVLETHPKIEVVLSLYERGSAVLAQFKSGSELLKDKALVCFDMTEELKFYLQNGTIQCVLVQQPRQIGISCIQVIMDAREAPDRILENSIFIPYDTITGESGEMNK